MRIGKIIITIFTWIIISFIMIWSTKESSIVRNNRALVDHQIEIENSDIIALQEATLPFSNQ